MDLIQMLTGELGISDDQAAGGSGLLFKLAKEKLGAEEFSQVANAIPGVEGLITAAPKPEGLLGAIGGLASAFGLGGGQLGSLAGLAGGFQHLQLDSGMIGKFVPIILAFVQAQGGDSVKALLEKVMQ